MFKTLEGQYETKIALKKKLRQYEQWEKFVKIYFSIFYVTEGTVTGPTNLFGVLCGYETLSPTMKKRHRLSV